MVKSDEPSFGDKEISVKCIHEPFNDEIKVILSSMRQPLILLILRLHYARTIKLNKRERRDTLPLKLP